MFRIPLDTSKANPEAANEILKEYLQEENTHRQDKENATENSSEMTKNGAEPELNPESDMEPMPNYKDKWTISS